MQTAKKDKEKTFFVALAQKYDECCISSVIEFEIYTGASNTQIHFWKNVLENMILAFDRYAAQTAVTILRQLKLKRKSIDKADLFIAAIAVANDLPLATLNQKDLEHIDNLKLVTIPS